MAIALEMWNGSVCVTVTVGTSPTPATTGATRAAIATASSRSGTRPGSAAGGTKRVGHGHEVGAGGEPHQLRRDTAP